MQAVEREKLLDVKEKIKIQYDKYINTINIKIGDKKLTKNQNPNISLDTKWLRWTFRRSEVNNKGNITIKIKIKIRKYILLM